MRIACLITLTLSACTNVHVNRAALVASTAALACDWAQTRAAAERGWMRGLYEENPVLGPRPDPGLVDVYFLTSMIVNATAWVVMPPRYRLAFFAVAAVQVPNLSENADWGLGVCGL